MQDDAPDGPILAEALTGIRKFLHPVDSFWFSGRVAKREVFGGLRRRGMSVLVGVMGLVTLPTTVGCGTAELPPVCTPEKCAVGTSCVQGRCRSDDANVATTESTRLLLDASDIGVVASKSFEQRSSTDAVALGREANGDWVMLLSFSWHPPKDAIVDSAFIVLHTIEGAAEPSRPIPIELAPVLSDWGSEELTWGRQPRLGVARPGIPLTGTVTRVRTEVTDIVRAWKSEPKTQSVAILVDGVDPVGVTLSTGLSRGPGPRLEVYLR